MATATALLRFNDKEAQKLLQEALCGKRHEEASSAAKALAQSPHPVALPWLIEVLGDDKASIGYDAAKALGELGDKSATEPLMNALRDEDKWVRRSAAEALAKLKEEQAVGPLIELLAGDPDDSVRKAAHDALREITGQNFGWNYQRWRRWYEDSKNR
jgi:HEAT repeat protein